MSDVSSNSEEVMSLCSALRAEPLFHISLGSKELFHSNFIAWFVDSFPDLAAKAFSSWGDAAPGVKGARAEREPVHLDIVLHLQGLQGIAVENKVFSVPDESQLDTYAEGAINQREAGGLPYSRVLLSLMDPGWSTGTYKDWRLKTYRDLANALQSQEASVRAADSFSADLIHHYIGLIGALSRLVTLLGEPRHDQPLLLPGSVLRELDIARISAGIQKARASRVARDLRRAAESRWPDVEVDHDFTNGTSLIEVFRKLPTRGAAGEPPDSLGWQIQGSQFRLAIVTGGLRGAEHRQEREVYVAQRYGGWFAFGLLARVTGVAVPDRLTEVRGGKWAFQSYNPNFVYRYRDVPDLTPDQIVELGIAYLERAEELLG